jgi:hypothetical protein
MTEIIALAIQDLGWKSNDENERGSKLTTIEKVFRI